MDDRASERSGPCPSPIRTVLAANLEAGVLVAKQPAGQLAEFRVAGQFQPLDTAQVVKDGGRKSAKMVLGERHVAHGLETAEDLSRQPGDVGPGEVERQKTVADPDERLGVNSLAEVVSLKVQLHHLCDTYSHRIIIQSQNGTDKVL